MLVPGGPGGSPRGGRWDATPHFRPGLTLVSGIPESCRGAGRRAGARVVSANLASGSAQGANLLISDYQKPLPDSTDHDGKIVLTSADASR